MNFKFDYVVLVIAIIVLTSSLYGLISNLIAGTYSFGNYDYGLLIGIALIFFYLKGGSRLRKK